MATRLSDRHSISLCAGHEKLLPTNGKVRYLINQSILLNFMYSKRYVLFFRQIGFIEGQSKGPVVHHLTSSINGISTIKCFRSQERFIRKFDMYQNDYSSALFSLITSRRWLVYMMDSIQVIFLAGVFLFLGTAASSIDPTTMGLVVSNLLALTAEFQWLVINWTDFSTFITSGWLF